MGRRNDSVARDVVKGALAGLVATWVMDRVTTAMYDRQDPRARRREERVRGGKTAYTIAAEKAVRAVGLKASKRQLQTAGRVIHWWLGAEAGISYALARRRMPSAGRLKGLGFGSGFWLVVDEIANPLLGITKGPRAFPWQAHARGLAGHLAFGVSAHLTLRVLDRVG